MPSLLPDDIHEQALRSMRRIASLHWRGPVEQHEATAQLSLLLARIARRCASLSSVKTDSQSSRSTDLVDRLRAAEEFALNRMPHPVTVTDMAASIGMTRENIFRDAIVEKRRKSPGQFLRTIRLDETLLLMQNPNVSFAEIAQQLGFVNQGNFSHWFQRMTQQTPTEWRNEELLS